MGFWGLRRKANETLEEKAARQARAAHRDAVTYDAIMNAFVQPLPTFSQWVGGAVPRGHPPTYENVVAQNTYQPATYYPNQAYENPYGHAAYQYSVCPSNGMSIAGSEMLPAYVETYNPYARQVISS